ncbi:MAG: class I SAM-dependent methyltransferase [Thermoplasmata archaeon]|nr:class I SAM-dependent methyltransferase [Thermoplasmata archaeon]
MGPLAIRYFMNAAGDGPSLGRIDWEAGDFAVLATGQTIVGELLCEAVGLRARERVLDVATGSGNVALAAARRRARATGVDFVLRLLERARERAAVERLPIQLCVGDARRLPFLDGPFDAVLSAFGVMFVPNAELAASELRRVCRAGGRVGLASWTPNGFIGRQFDALERPPRSPGRSDARRLWGTEEGLHQLFGSAADVRVVPRSLLLRGDSVERMVEGLRRNLGPMVQVFARLDAAQGRLLESELLDLVRQFNVAGDGTALVPADYLEAVVRM